MRKSSTSRKSTICSSPTYTKTTALSSRDYKGVETREITYKNHDGYSLTLAIDMAASDAPTPVVFYLHGGGWERGNNGSLRVQSQYMAKQHGVTGVRVSYTLAPQPDATVQVSIQDVKDAVQYIRDHAKELNIDPSRMGFVGTSAGAHLAAVAAMTTPEAKAFVGYSGIYNLETAAITSRAKKEPRVTYFCGKDPKVLRDASPMNLIPKNASPQRCSSAGRPTRRSNMRKANSSRKRCGTKEPKTWNSKSTRTTTTTSAPRHRTKWRRYSS